MKNTPTSENTWSGIFLTISDTAPGSNRNKSDYLVADMLSILSEIV